MADDNFRAYRSRDPLPRDEADRTASDAGDPLAELARLIGQTDPYNEPRRADAQRTGRPDQEVEASAQSWAADEDYPEEDVEEPYVPPPAAPLQAAPHPSYAPPERSYENGPPPSGQYFSGSAAQFSGFREEPAAEYHEDQVPALRARELPAYALAESEEDYADQPEHDEGQPYASDDYYDEPPAPRRRGAVVVVMAVLGFAVIGTAGAFGYRAMFGGSVLPTLPPIIRASNGPVKVAPNYGEAQASNSGQTGPASASSGEKLVSREEQPVNMEPPKVPPRVVASIPIVGGQSATPAATPAPPALANAAPNAGTASPWPPPPPMPTVAPAPAPAATPPVSAAPKRIHTVTIRSDQAAANGASMPPSTMPSATMPPAARTAARHAPAQPKPTATAGASPAGSNAPLSIVPGGQSEAAARPPRAHATAAPIAVASAGPVAAVPHAPASGGYAVQVTSQRSETEAQASFRELRAKFPHQLSGREPIIRRADLGAKGTYYRALVGPFASAEQAAEMCSGLKAAGGNCIVQRN